MASDRFRKALSGAVKRAEDRQWVFGTLGRKDSDGGHTFVVPGRRGFVYVTIRQGNGAQTVVPARNDFGIEHRFNVGVRMKLEHGVYVVLGRANRSDLVSTPESPEYGVFAHAATHQHGGVDEIAVSIPAANAIPKADASGLLDDWVTPFHTQEEIEDFVAAQFVGNTGVIDATYDDGTGAITLTLDVSAADRYLYSTGVDTWAEGTITSFARGLLDDSDAATMRSTLELIAGGAGDIWVEKSGDTMTGNLVIEVDGATAGVLATSYRDAATGAYIVGEAARGSLASPTVSVNGDYVFRMIARGYSAAFGDFVNLAQIAMQVDGTPDSGGDTTDMPGAITFWTVPEGSSTLIQRMKIAQDGNIGIGTSSPLALLHIGSGSDTPVTSTYQLYVANPGISNFVLRNTSNDIEISLGATAAITYIGSRTDHPFQLYQNNAAVVTLDDGKVSIGETVPKSLLQVNSPIGENIPSLGSPGGQFLVTNTGNYGLLFGQRGDGRAWIQVQRIDGTATAYDLIMQPNGGNVGIGGDTTPTVPLHVAKDATFLATFETLGSTKNAVVTFNAPAGKNTNFSFNEGGAIKKMLRYDATANGFGVVASDEATFHLFVADATGNVGIGTTSPQGKHHVYDGTGGHLVVTKTGVNGTTQVIIPNGTGDVTRACFVQFVLTDGTSAVANTFSLVQGVTVTSDIAVGGSTWRVTLNANGELSVARVAGSATATIKFTIDWI